MNDDDLLPGWDSEQWLEQEQWERDQRLMKALRDGNEQLGDEHAEGK